MSDDDTMVLRAPLAPVNAAASVTPPVQRHEHHHTVVVEMRHSAGTLDDDRRREMLRRFERELRPLIGTDAEAVARKLALVVMAMLETDG